MYEAFYGLRTRPFDLTANPRYLLLTDQHREALGNLEYGITARKGITVLVGEAGTGKTTLIRTMLARAEGEYPGSTKWWAYLKNPAVSRDEFFEFLSTRLGLPPYTSGSKLRLLDALERALTGERSAALIIDEAQRVSNDLLEEIRLLVNIESDDDTLLPVLLVGQPELADRLNEPSLRQLKQRIALRCSLAPLTLRECGSYIAARIEVAGGNPGRLFSREAVMAIHNYSGGIPRTISVICDNALLSGFAEERQPITAELIDTVCSDFDLQPSIGAPSDVPQRIALPAASGTPVAAKRYEPAGGEKLREIAAARRPSLGRLLE